MARALRILLALALVSALSVGTAGAEQPDDRAIAGAVDNNTHRQALLHRTWPSGGVAGSMLVTTSTPAVAADLAADEGGVAVGNRTVLLHVTAGSEAIEAGRIAARIGVVAVEPDRPHNLAVVPNDPSYSSQWSHGLTHIETAWDITTGSATVQVAVLDTGMDARHEDLLGNIAEQVDVSSGRAVSRRVGSDNDSCNFGHGTFVAGVIGALGNNSIGVAGVAWDVSIIDVALSSPASRCGILDSAIIAGLDYVSDRTDPVDVVNLSLGGISESCPTAVQTAIDAARAAGTVVVAASGNDELRAPGVLSVPASCDGVISVGSVGQFGSVAVYSTQNDSVDIAAPGGDTSVGSGIVSTLAGGGYAEEEGTSFSSPYIAGAAALLRSIDASLTPDEIESYLEHTAQEKGATGRDPAYGWGLVDVGAAVAMADAGTDPGPPEPDPAFAVDDRGTQVERIAAEGRADTEAISQAVAMSKATFETDLGVHAVIARSDDFADALAGSALGYGLGPLLFTRSTGPLASSTAVELQRVLPGGSTVYLLGGTAALPSTLEGEITDLGYQPVRVAGPTRQQTAVAVAEQLESFLESNDFQLPKVAVVATAFNWPDAVTAGEFGAWFGMPILVTSPDSLDPDVESFLSQRTWDAVYVIGGTAAISIATKLAISDAANLSSGRTIRLAGVDRSSTAVAVAQEFEDVFQATFDALPQQVAAVNLRRADGFAHVLSASARIGQRSGVFVPVEGDTGNRMSDEAQAYTCRFPVQGLIVGHDDLITESTAMLVDSLLKGDAAACTS